LYFLLKVKTAMFTTVYTETEKTSTPDRPRCRGVGITLEQATGHHSSGCGCRLRLS
jgi:hypothetical protein